MNKLTTFAQVRQLSEWQAVCFCAALLSRMTPNYALFAEITEQESPDILDKVLVLIIESLKSPKSKVNFGLQREKVEQAAPDISQYDLFGVYPANDACMAMVATLNILTGDDPQGAVVVSKLSQGGVEAYLLSSGEGDDDSIKTHPLMQFEIQIQQELIDLLSDESNKKTAVEKMIALATEEKMTNIGVTF